MIYIIITSYNEPITTEKTINQILDSNIKEDYKIIVSDPFPEIKDFIQKKFKDKVEFFLDPGEGKSTALNIIFNNIRSNNPNDIIFSTDGDVFLDKNAINEILKQFKDKKVGCVSGRPVSINSRNTMFGYLSHFLFDVGAHQISRKKNYEKNKFLECSGYLFAFRNNIINEIPIDVAEDSIIPYYFYKKGYKIGYAENAKVYVKNPTNLKDFIKQRKRTADAHTKLTKYAPDFPKVKSFKGEIIEGGIKGFFEIFSYPKNLKEFFWTIAIFPIRLYIWLRLFYDLKKKKEYGDGWRENLEVKSTRHLD